MGFPLPLLNLAGSVALLLWGRPPHQRTTPATTRRSAGKISRPRAKHYAENRRQSLA